VRKNIYGREVVRCGKGGEEKVQGTRLVAEPDLCSAPAILFFLCSFFCCLPSPKEWRQNILSCFFSLRLGRAPLLCFFLFLCLYLVLSGSIESSVSSKATGDGAKKQSKKNAFFFMFIVVEIRFFLYRCRSMSPYFVICVKRVVLGTRCFDSLC